MHELFKSYPSVNRFHITEDGQAFEDLQHAEAHAKGGKIEVVEREAEEGKPEGEKPKAKGKK